MSESTQNQESPGTTKNTSSPSPEPGLPGSTKGGGEGSKRRPLVTYGIVGGASALALWAAVSLLPRQPQRTLPEPKPEQRPPKVMTSAAKPQVDVVFVLDTTGSMNAMLEGAKRKIWEIARYIAQGQPAPDLRIGLVAYRDVGDEYVTKFFDLTDDLDGVYQNLVSFHAGGGGDSPEHVAQALHEALNKSSWSSRQSALKLIYLVGDAPPHTDYNDGYNFRALAQQAGERGIAVNTIRCGQSEDTRVAWLEIANRSGGEFNTIEQSGGMAHVSTPYDDELARLNRALTETALHYGSAERRAASAAKSATNLAAPAAAQAERAGWYGIQSARGKAAATSAGDLLADVADKRVDLKNMNKDELPEGMQAMTDEERTQHLEKRKQQRQGILEQINALSSKRDGYLRTAAPKPTTGFDGRFRATLKKQAAKVDLLY